MAAVTTALFGSLRAGDELVCSTALYGGTLHLIDTYRIGGPGKTIINSAKFIDPAYRVHVGAFTRPQPGFDEFSTAVRA